LLLLPSSQFYLTQSSVLVIQSSLLSPDECLSFDTLSAFEEFAFLFPFQLLIGFLDLFEPFFGKCSKFFAQVP